MNEKKYRFIISAVIVLFVTVLVIQSVTDGAAIRRADTQIDALERQLSDATRRVEESRRELEDCRGTVRQCYTSVGRIANDIGRQSEELSDIIGKLKVIRTEIENMENALSFFYIKYGYNDNDYYCNGEVEQ